MEIEALSDEAIVQAVQRGDTAQFGSIVDRYEQRLKRYGKKFLSGDENIEDIVQDIFLATFSAIQSFDTGSRFSPWIYRIAHNAFVNALRKGKYRPLTIDLDTLVAYAVYEDPQERERDIAEMRRFIDAGLSKLSLKYREVLLLHYFEEMSYKDIADILKVPIGTVGVRLRRAKEALHAVIGNYHEQL